MQALVELQESTRILLELGSSRQPDHPYGDLKVHRAQMLYITEEIMSFMHMLAVAKWRFDCQRSGQAARPGQAIPSPASVQIERATLTLSNVSGDLSGCVSN